jgi:hypothetical protein
VGAGDGPCVILMVGAHLGPEVLAPRRSRTLARRRWQPHQDQDHRTGWPPRYYGYSIEIDHIVPLELGGSNAIGNLFPERGGGRASYHAEDALENRAKAWV